MSHPPVPPQPDPEEDISAESEDQPLTSISAFEEEVSLSDIVDPRKPPGT